ncbi:MAG: hypothetical protein PHZ19_04345 [Candidatus Thermoplasmatota archaeon]|nr:hypothetical protein [Candidatus Thermoplasmatota archaeon]
MGKLLVCGLTALLMVLIPLSGISLLKEDHRPLHPAEVASAEDLDPLVDIAVTVDIQKIRSLESDTLLGAPLDKIDVASDPDFYVKVFINGQEFTSPVWKNQKYVYEPEWSATLDVPDDVELVNITIQLWDANPGIDTLCDISNNDDTYPGTREVTLWYSIKSGHWFGDDYIQHQSYWGDPDPSGYGRANGCDDNSIYQSNQDCELWFDIYQNDYDGDGIPYWTEVNVYGTDPETDNRGEDADGDGVPIEWEHRWGHSFRRHWGRDTVDHVWMYDPFVWDDHASLDPDNDGLSNVEEYLTSQWGSDPFRKDLFIELDQMDASSDGISASLLPEASKELLRTAYNRQNIVYHLDDGCMGGGEILPFDIETTGRGELSEEYYTNYFLHNGDNIWRQGVFHYSVIVYDAGFNGFAVRRDMWQISSKYIEEKCQQLFFVDPAVVYASVYMHETGHSLDIYNPGVDNPNTMYPWTLDYWKYRPYKSCMNYGYTYVLVDYSDGSRGMNDWNDWNDLDLTYFDSGW